MNLSLKITCSENVDSEILDILRDGKYHDAKLSTNKIELKMDRRDDRYIDSLGNVKIALKKEGQGYLILMGKLSRDFRRPYGGSFHIVKKIDEISDFKQVKGVPASIRFSTMDEDLTRNDELSEYMQNLINNPNFEFNIGQFSEFMDIFKFYKDLSDELNNNFSFEITSISKPYYFIPIHVKDLNLEIKEEIKDQNGLLKGYKISEITYERLKNEVKSQVLKLIDIHIKDSNEPLRWIKRVGYDNIFLSNKLKISEKDVENLKQFEVINSNIVDKEVVLSGEFKNNEDYEKHFSALNLYDMGQKIKIDSIDNSLRLINQGATGSAISLLEYLIGDSKMPTKYLEPTEVTNKYTNGLNNSQKQAFLMAVDGSPVSLIKGPPGTGKTHVINAIVQYITKELGQKVVISSQTHIAIDNVLDKLMQNFDIIIPNRITNRKNKYSGNEIDSTLYKTWAQKFSEHNKNVTDLKLSAAMEKQMAHFAGEPRFKYTEYSSPSNFPVIGITTTSSALGGKKGFEILKGYDWLIIDEVSKCPISEVLRYLPYVSKVILVGDNYQLAPLLEFSKEDVKDLPSYNEDKFEKLQNIYEQSVFDKVMDKAQQANRLVLLNENYRSVKPVLAAYNVFYDNKLENKREQVRPNKVRFNVTDNSINYDTNDIFFVEVLNGQEAREGTSRFNIEEINATAFILRDVMQKAIDPENISVSAIFPYAAQIEKFQKQNIALINEAKKLFKSFEIDTVDAFQGKESDVVLVNTVVTDASQLNFLNDFRRINVAMSRARDKLIIFGNNRVLRQITMKILNGQERKYFNEIISYITSKGKFIEYNGGKVKHADKSKSSFKLA